MVELRAEWTWYGSRLRPGLAVDIGDDGRIAAVRPTADKPQPELRDVALFPGCVNAHSHAFQWGLRGLVQRDEHDGTFFSWRDRMFALTAELDAERIWALSKRAFSAMRAAGYTSVGEFHYVHHRADGRPYRQPTALAEAVIEAARQVGLRICLLHAAYLRPSGVTSEVAPGQRRFCDPDVAGFLDRHAKLAAVVERLGDPRVTLGVAPHSVRTVPPAALERIVATTTGPLHIHVNEQSREIDESIEETGRRPLAVIERAGGLARRTTLIHMTQADEGELEATARTGARICFCPTTERDLGDGIGPSRVATALGIPQCIGSDSQARIDPFEEVRLLDGHERLRRQARLVLRPTQPAHLATHLLDVATRGGAGALDLATGAIEPGHWADLLAVDLSDPDFAGVEADVIPDVLVFSGTPRAVRRTWVGGERSR